MGQIIVRAVSSKPGSLRCRHILWFPCLLALDVRVYYCCKSYHKVPECYIVASYKELWKNNTLLVISEQWHRCWMVTLYIRAHMQIWKLSSLPLCRLQNISFYFSCVGECRNTVLLWSCGLKNPFLGYGKNKYFWVCIITLINIVNNTILSVNFSSKLHSTPLITISMIFHRYFFVNLQY